MAIWTDHSAAPSINSGLRSVRASTTRTLASLPALWTAVLLAVSVAGCKSSAPAATNESVAGGVQSSIASDSAVAGLPVRVTVQNGVVTLGGTVANEAQRSLAARDAAGVAGVREVVNNLTVSSTPPPSAIASTQAPALPATVTKHQNEVLRPEPGPRPLPGHPQPDHQQPNHQQPDKQQQDRQQQDRQAGGRQPAPIERRTDGYNPPPAPSQPALAPAPAASQQPTFRTVTIPAGTTIPVRMTQTLDSAVTQEGSAFSGVVASDLLADGIVAIPAGSNVSGSVDAAHEAAHFQGSSLLTVSLNGITHRGERSAIQSEPYSVQGKGRGVNTAEKAAGGAAIGAILGGIFGGGKGAAIGAAAGGGAGAGSQAITRGQQVQIASESVVRFRLTSPITLRVRTDGGLQPRNDGGLQPPTDGGLQRRPELGPQPHP
jgi:hypothetical protein